MNIFETFGFITVFIMGTALTLGVFAKRFAPRVRKTIFFGYILHAFGSIARYFVLYSVYDGGDAGRYFRLGSTCANFIWNFDITFLAMRYWRFKQFWGTQFTIFVSGFVLSVIGQSQHGEFLFFSILGFGGCLLICKAFEKNFPESSVLNYGRWVLFWPSLCFWPSSVGKDALMLLATGLVIYGYTVSNVRIRWFSLLSGMLLASCVRPHVAGVMVVSIAIAHWIAPKRRITTGYYIQGFFILILLGVVLQQGFAHMGLGEVDVENLRGYIGTISTRTGQGGSAITTPTAGITGIPLAFVNMLFRPFPWEAGNILSFAASMEMIIFWSMIIKRKERVFALAKSWRSTRLMRLAIPLTILYVLMLGMAVGNLGIIVRQRIHILPLLFLWLEGYPELAKRNIPMQTERSLALAETVPALRT